MGRHLVDVAACAREGHLRFPSLASLSSLPAGAPCARLADSSLPQPVPARSPPFPPALRSGTVLAVQGSLRRAARALDRSGPFRKPLLGGGKGGKTEKTTTRPASRWSAPKCTPVLSAASRLGLHFQMTHPAPARVTSIFDLTGAENMLAAARRGQVEAYPARGESTNSDRSRGMLQHHSRRLADVSASARSAFRSSSADPQSPRPRPP